MITLRFEKKSSMENVASKTSAVMKFLPKAASLIWIFRFCSFHKHSLKTLKPTRLNHELSLDHKPVSLFRHSIPLCLFNVHEVLSHKEAEEDIKTVNIGDEIVYDAESLHNHAQLSWTL